jgi:hypothetical protein
MLAQNRVTDWGTPHPQWVCEHCGISNNSWDKNGNLAHVYRQAMALGGPPLDLCGLCRASLSITKTASPQQGDLFLSC